MARRAFTFAFDATYSYGDGIANLGTYAPVSKSGNGGYSDQKWLRFDRHPHHRAGVVRQLADGEVDKRRVRRGRGGQALFRA